MKIKLPRNLEYDLDNIPEDFDEQIHKAFHDYTELTREEYRYQDKLCFIDRVVDMLHGERDVVAIVDDWLDRYSEYERRANDHFITREDAYGWDSMVEMVEVGKKQQSLYSEYTQKGSRSDEKIMKLLCRIIKVVMDYPDE